MNTQLSDLTEQLDRASQSAAALCEGLTAEHLTERWRPDRWSIAENLAHLSLTTSGMVPLIREAIDDARSRNLVSAGPYRFDMWGRVLRWSIEPPPRFRVKTTAPFVPVDVDPPERVLPDFLALQEELRSTIASADGLAIDRVRITSPFAGRVKYNVFSAFSILLAHERRHIWQAQFVKGTIQER